MTTATELQILNQVPNIVVVDQASLETATATLSTLNTFLDTIIAEKEKVTKPLNEALKAERARFKPNEEKLTNAITQVKTSITTYVNKQIQEAKELEQKILADGRTSTETKISKLATIDDSATDKVQTSNGSVSFTTVKKYAISDPINADHLADLWRKGILELNTTALKAYIKESGNIPNGITVTEEQSLRNYR